MPLTELLFCRKIGIDFFGGVFVPEAEHGKCSCTKTEKLSVLVGTHTFLVARCLNCGEFKRGLAGRPIYFVRVSQNIFLGTKSIPEEELPEDFLSEFRKIAEKFNLVESGRARWKN